MHLYGNDLQDEENPLVVTTEDTQQPNSRESTSIDSPEASPPPDGLKASLSKDRELTLRWVEEAPLRLVAAVLADANRRTATVAEIRSTLSPEVINSEDWNRWWNIVRVGLRDSRQFSYGPRKPIRLRTLNPAEVESDSLDNLRAVSRRAQSRTSTSHESSAPAPSISGLGGWILWVQADEEEPMPRSVPSDDFIRFLQRLPGSVTPTAVCRLSSGIEQRLIESKQRPAANSVEQWQKAFISALSRWSEQSELPGVQVESTISLTIRVLEALGSAEFEDVVEWIASYTSKSSGNPESVGVALLNVSTTAPNGTTNLLSRLNGMLDASTRIAFWQKLLSKGLMRPDKPPLGQWMRILNLEDKVDVFVALLTTIYDESSIARICELLEIEWKQVDSTQHYKLFDAVAVAWALHRQSMPVSKKVMLEAASYGEREDNSSLLSEWRSIMSSLSEKERESSKQREAELEQQLYDTKSELDRAGRQIEFLRGENRSRRRSAEIEITRDAITVLGLALQDLATAPKFQALEDIESSVILALSTLGAKPFGSVGALAKFDPALHEATPTPITGTPVRVMAPGLTYSRRSDSPAIFMKSKTQEEA